MLEENGGVYAGRFGQVHWNFKLFHQKNGASSPDSQDSSSCELGGVSSLLSATKTQGVLYSKGKLKIHTNEICIIIISSTNRIGAVVRELVTKLKIILSTCFSGWENSRHLAPPTLEH